MYDFFISHSSRLNTDANRFVRTVAARLNSLGYNVYLDVNTARRGDIVTESVRTAIEDCLSWLGVQVESVGLIL